MTKMRFEDYVIPAARLGEETRLPDIGNVGYIHAGYTMSERVSEEDARYIGKGMIPTMLPYMQQDNYDRSREKRAFRAAILENDCLCAVFLPQLGGRLWSLFDKRLQRELLYVNPVFQPANLALRNAWFSGGVEWNIGIKGHNPLTCSPLYACRIRTPQGEEGLRMYEYERIRSVVYHMDFLLKGAVLYVRTTVENTEDREKYMYWWSNIAVPETPHTRIITSARDALQTHYGENGYVLDAVDVPYPVKGGADCTYPALGACSRDYFFRVPKEERKWVAAAEADGKGLLQFSTKELIGRKLFLWGQGQGGRNWNRWLSGEDKPYVEIQAGLARTQYEHVPMAGKKVISWVEGYTALDCAPAKLHGAYPEAIEEVSRQVETVMPEEEEMRALFDGIAAEKPEQLGSGWGCVENAMRARCAKPPVSALVEFPEAAVSDTEAEWMEFVKTGRMRDSALREPPKSFYVSPDVLPLFEKQRSEGEANARMELQYGTALYACGQTAAAEEAYLRSYALRPNAWACRNLSMIEKNERNNIQKALEYMEAAINLNREYRGLLINCAQVMLEAKAYARWVEVFDGLDQELREDGRLKLYKAVALIALDRCGEAAKILDRNFVLYDIQEGEVSISHIWPELYGKLIREKYPQAAEDEVLRLMEEEYPLPAHLDFRMS